MSMTDAVKRKEPEPEEKEAPAAAAAAAPAAPAPAAVAPADPKSQEPASKRLKATPDPAAVRKQVEYYLSDMNLKFDKFFHEKIAADAEGWLNMELIVGCNKLKVMNVTKEDVVNALKESKIEVREDGSAIRRPGNAALPSLESRPQHVKKSTIHAHDGGVIAVVKNVPAEENWTKVKDMVKEKLPPKVTLWHVSQVSDDRKCILAFSPFEGDLQFLEGLEFEIGDAKLKVEVCHDDALQAALKALPRGTKEKRDKELKKRQKERNRPVMIGTQRFVNVTALKGRVREILNSRSDGEHLKPDGTDFKLIKALLEYHPKGAEKASGLTGIKVGKSNFGDSRCFFMVKSDGTEEDFSAMKCLNELEMNPPYVTAEPKKEPAKSSSSEAPKPASSDADKKDEKVSDAKQTEKATEETKAADETKKDTEETKEETKEDAAEKKGA